MEASEDPQPWRNYISSDPLHQELARLKEEVRNFSFLFTASEATSEIPRAGQTRQGKSPSRNGGSASSKPTTELDWGSTE
jgi:hypothetical protein